MKTVAIFGAGVAGLSAAHEFVRLGYKVSVYEINSNAGGFFRSVRRSEDNNMPSEYSWHGIGPWYHNVFDIMQQIPFNKTDSVYNKALSRPINFAIIPDKIDTKFNDTYAFDLAKLFRMTYLDKLMFSWVLLKTWTANRRTFEYYSSLNADKYWQPIMSKLGLKTWKSSFGPWIGSDWTNISLHHVGQFFQKNMMSGTTYKHPADAEGPAWTHGSGNGWLLLCGPSNEYWFDKWVKHLETSGVQFFWQTALHKFDFDGKKITGAYLESGTKIQADYYVMAVNPFATVDILARTPALAKLDQLKLFKPLVRDGPHTQVSFRIAFSEEIKWTRKRTGFVVADSEYNITIFAEEQIWATDVDLGKGVKSLWTGTACVGTIPGRIYNLPVNKCTKEQFIAEVLAQTLSCEGLDFIIKEANNNRNLDSFSIIQVEVWHEWIFSPNGIKAIQPKWVTTTNTQPYMPTQATPVPNLVLAGAHTKTQADLWSIEAAVESGRRATKVIEPSVKVIPQYKALPLRMISTIDDLCFAVRAPHILTILLITTLIALIFML